MGRELIADEVRRVATGRERAIVAIMVSWVEVDGSDGPASTRDGRGTERLSTGIEVNANIHR